MKPDSKVQAMNWNRPLGIHEYTHRRMVFGKYTNVMIKDLPTDYVKWCILNLTDVYWLNWLTRELQRRDKSYA
jgi:uncharacterized protein (DUF3820 family)